MKNKVEVESGRIAKAESGSLKRPALIHVICGETRCFLNLAVVRLLIENILTSNNFTVTLSSDLKLWFENKTAKDKRAELYKTFGFEDYRAFLENISLHVWSYSPVREQEKINPYHIFDLEGPFNLAIHVFSLPEKELDTIRRLPESDGCFYLSYITIEEDSKIEFLLSGVANDISA